MSKVKRSLIRTFVNTGTTLAPTWSLLGAGVTTGKITYNPKTSEETYITDDTASIAVESYAPTMAVEMTAKSEDAVFAWLDTLRKARGTLSTAETEVVNVWLYKTPAGGYYYAEKQSVSIQVDDFGGDGGTAAKVNFTINFVGDPTLGVFDPTNLVFEANPVTTILTTMACSGVTLVPLFSADHSNLLYTASVANGVSSTNLTSTLVGATIVQKVGNTTVNQGAAASLSVGVNHITFQVTVGSEVNTYRVDITRAAA